MIERLCPRCGWPQSRESANTLSFCANCGLPQVVLSEELRDQFAEQERAAEAGEAPLATDGSKPPPPEAVVWRGAILAALAAGAVAAGLTLVSFALPPLVLFSWLWAVGAPIIALGVYSTRFRSTRISPGFGARLGLLCGLAISLAIGTMDIVKVLLSRFLFHSAAQLDAQLAAFFAQVSANMVARSGADVAGPFLHLFALPEFRAGILLSSLCFSVSAYLVFSAVGGAFAGLLRSRNGAKQPGA